MSQERFFQLLGRKMAGEATVDELAGLEELMQGNEEWKKFAEQLMTNHPLTTGQDETEADAAFAVHIAKFQLTGHGPEKTGAVHSGRNLFFWTMRIAAVLVIVIAGIYTFNLFKVNNNIASVVTEKPVKETIITQNGSRTRSLLADGTTVWLNVGSKLYYENNFNGATREVSLEGEAFFDVVKQPNRPFIVHSSDIAIRVLGTAFNVKSYPEDKNVEITLYHGLVLVGRQKNMASNGIQLIPNHKLILPKQGTSEIPYITPIDSTKKESERIETAWRYNRLEFRGDSFEEAAKKLERWYNVTIVFRDERVKQLNGVTGSIETETVAQAFAALKELYPINYKITNHEIFVESSQ